MAFNDAGHLCYRAPMQYRVHLNQKREQLSIQSYASAQLNKNSNLTRNVQIKIQFVSIIFATHYVLRLGKAQRRRFQQQQQHVQLWQLRN